MIGKKNRKNQSISADVKSNRNLGFSDDAQLQEEIAKNQVQNMRLGNAQIKLLGDKLTLVQVVKLLAYVRHAVNSHQEVELKVKIGSHIADGQLMFDVNGFEVPDCITQDEIEID